MTKQEKRKRKQILRSAIKFLDDLTDVVKKALADLLFCEEMGLPPDDWDIETQGKSIAMVFLCETLNDIKAGAVTTIKQPEIIPQGVVPLPGTE